MSMVVYGGMVVWKKRELYSTGRRDIILAASAALLVGLLSCVIGSKIWGYYRSASDKYAVYSVIQARYPGQDLNGLLKKLKARAVRK